MPMTSVERKKVGHPMASTANPLAGPASRRGSANKLENNAYCVAENRFCVMRSSSTLNAPVPIPDVSNSKLVAAYMSGRFGPPACATRK